MLYNYPQPPPPNTNVGRSDWMDLGGFSALICELQEQYHKINISHNVAGIRSF